LMILIILGKEYKLWSSSLCSFLIIIIIIIIIEISQEHTALQIRTMCMTKQIGFKITVFWVTTQCSQLKVTWRFGGTYRLHLQCKEQFEQNTSLKVSGKQKICWSDRFVINWSKNKNACTVCVIAM
jgi:hypothetical protein